MALPNLLIHPNLALIFGSVLIDQLGVPIPALPILVLAGAAAADGDSSVAAFAAVAVPAALIADVAWYAAGRRYGTRMLSTLCRISMSPDVCVRQTEGLFLRFGLRVLMVAKFIPGAAAVGTAMAGVTRTSLLRFLLYDGIGASIWVALFLTFGFVFHAAVDDLLETAARFGRAGLGGLLLLLAGYVALRAWRRYAFLRALSMARIGVDELRAQIDAGTPPLILDVRSAIHQTAEGRIPGARPYESGSALQPIIESAEDREIVIYCSCPNEVSAARIAKQLHAAGFTRVRPLTGGIDAWRAAGYPIEPDSAPTDIADEAECRDGETRRVSP